MKWVICDWANNRPFGYKTFKSFEDADEYLEDYLFARVCGPKSKRDRDLDEDQWSTFYELKDEYWIRPYKEAKKTWL